MKILATSWMLMNDGSKGWEGYAVLENVQDLDHFKSVQEDEVFDIVFEYHLIPKETQYSVFENEHFDFAKYLDSRDDKKIDELQAKLLLSTKKAFI